MELNDALPAADKIMETTIVAKIKIFQSLVLTMTIADTDFVFGTPVTDFVRFAVFIELISIIVTSKRMVR